jgi:uncharacterized protein YcfL
VSERLTRLPWVDADTIKTDPPKRQVRFTLKPGAQFSLEDVKKTLGARYNDGVKLLVGPTTQ